VRKDRGFEWKPVLFLNRDESRSGLQYLQTDPFHPFYCAQARCGWKWALEACVSFGEEPPLRNRFQVGAGGAIDHMTEAIEAGAVAGAVPRLFGGVPAHDAFQVRTDGRKPVQSS
jgi:hypothetical protein